MKPLERGQLPPDPFTMEVQLCHDDGIVRGGAMHHGDDYPCTGHAHYAGEHIRCTSPAHATESVTGRPINGWQVSTAGDDFSGYMTRQP